MKYFWKFREQSDGSLSWACWEYDGARVIETHSNERFRSFDQLTANAAIYGYVKNDSMHVVQYVHETPRPIRPRVEGQPSGEFDRKFGQ